MSDNTLDPLDQLASGGQQQPTQQSDVDPLDALSHMKPQAQATGEIANDIGKTVIVPKGGESFADTMERAAAHGKSVTQEDINDEMATAPKKAAQVLGGAVAAGAGGLAALAGTGEAIFGSSVAFKAVVEMAKAHPVAAKMIAKVLTGAVLGHEIGHTTKSAALGALLSTLTQ
jgi:hypothetical protein